MKIEKPYAVISAMGAPVHKPGMGPDGKTAVNLYWFATADEAVDVAKGYAKTNPSGTAYVVKAVQQVQLPVDIQPIE